MKGKAYAFEVREMDQRKCRELVEKWSGCVFSTWACKDERTSAMNLVERSRYAKRDLTASVSQRSLMESYIWA